MIRLPHLAARIFDVPLAIEPGKLDVILVAIGPRLEGFDPPMPPEGAGVQRKPYAVTPEGIALINVMGTLVHRASGMDALSGLTSYDQLADEILDAATDPAIRGIMLNIDSPGGEVAGLFDLADEIYSAREAKPICAVTDSAFSAAYLLASAAGEIWTSQFGGNGSIGVIWTHMDQSKADAKEGLKYTIVRSRPQKAAGNVHEELSPEALANMQSLVARADGMLVAAVARNRGLSTKAVEDTEAGLFFGQDAVDRGLADRVGTFNEALAAMTAAAQPKEKEMLMPAIAAHHTKTVDTAWDAGENEKRLKSGEKPAYYEDEYAWRDPEGNAETKGAYKFPHHEVAADGTVGAANLSACESIVAILNGGMGGAKIPDADRAGVHAHAAAHLKDGGKEAAELKGAEAAAAAYVETLVAQARAAGLSAAGEIVELCAVAGRPGLAVEFLAKRYTRQQASDEILKLRAAASGPEIGSHILPDAGTGTEPKPKDSPVVKAAEALAAASKGGK